MLEYPVAQRAIDDALEPSFPASDAPSWNVAVARPDIVTAGVIYVSTPTVERPVTDAFASVAGAATIVLLVPIAMLVVGLPLVLAIRGLLELIGWLFGVDLR